MNIGHQRDGKDYERLIRGIQGPPADELHV